MDGNPYILLTVELDKGMLPDLGYHKLEAQRLIESAFPDAHVDVRAGQMRWWDENESWSKAVV